MCTTEAQSLQFAEPVPTGSENGSEIKCEEPVPKIQSLQNYYGTGSAAPIDSLITSTLSRPQKV